MQGEPGLLKLSYEFWGFCVNGDNDLTGTIGSTKGFPVGGINMPSGFANQYLHASGSDGVTHVGMPFFSSSTGNFSSSVIIGKHLVTWQSGSTSTDDSIYEITQLINSTTIRVNVLQGGTPTQSTNWVPSFSERSSVNYRIVDIAATALLTYVSGNNLVFNINGAPQVNVGQLKPQVKVAINIAGSAYGLRMTLAPSGSWNGSIFTEGNNEFICSTGNGGDFGGSGTADFAFMTLVGSTDSLFAHASGRSFSPNGIQGSFGFLWEIPERLYPQANDPNPLAGTIWGAGVDAQVTTKGWNFYNMVCQDNKIRRWDTLFRCPTGLYENNGIYANGYSGTPAPRYNNLGYNPFNGTVPFMEAVLHQSTAGQWCLARVRLRRTRFYVNSMARDQIVGTGPVNSWYHMFDTVWIPWDGARLPNGAFPIGF